MSQKHVRVCFNLLYSTGWFVDDVMVLVSAHIHHGGWGGGGAELDQINLKLPEVGCCGAVEVFLW